VANAQATYVPIHQKYRPQTFAEVVGQEPIAATLSQAIGSGRIAKAYLFEGMRGTGKTSSARIFAKSLNCLGATQPTVDPCGECEVCQAIAGGRDLDVIEIDAASNTGVENIRGLIDQMRLAAMRSRYKVLIVDEVHRLSGAAMSALLKLLEEPPASVVIILATTEAHQILATIRSRTQQFQFQRIGSQSMLDHLSWIADEESIDITVDALSLIVQFSEGGMRDAEQLLDQCGLIGERVMPDHIWRLTGAVPESLLLEMIDALCAEVAIEIRVASVIEQSRSLINSNKSPIAITQGLARVVQLIAIARVRPEPLQGEAISSQAWAKIQKIQDMFIVEELRQMNSLIRQAEPQIRQAAQPQIWLESLLMELAGVVVYDQN
jgi:DNA polymerase III subunit gamma/tau